MNSLQIGLIIGFVLSLSLNGLFFWYLRKTTGRLLFISENLEVPITTISGLILVIAHNINRRILIS